MDRKEMKKKIAELKDLKNMKTEIEEAIDAIEAEIKAEMAREDVDTIIIDEFKVIWKPVTSSRIDSTSLKKALPEVFKMFSRPSTSRRFVVS